MRLALAQINSTVGDLAGNTRKILEWIERARQEGADLVAFPELAVTGYPPEDLLLKDTFVTANRKALREVARATNDVVTVVGFVDSDEGDVDQGATLYNAAAICQGGDVLAVYRKHLLPNYGVFDEHRYFKPGREHVLLETQSGVVGVCICEDAWSPTGPVVSQGDFGAEVIININASPYSKGKLPRRTEMLADRARRANASIVYVNLVGGQDELVFDGSSLVISPQGEIVARLPQFEEDFAVVDVPLGSARASSESGHGRVERVKTVVPEVGDFDGRKELSRPLEDEAEIYRALELGLRDYVRKNGFERVVVGLSGGIDSSLTGAIAADALGPDSVLGVAMPSRISSSSSFDDAKSLASNLGIELLEVSIGDIYDAYVSALRDAFGNAEEGIAEENLQSRARGNILMAVSNRYGHLVLATGNKSEMACGYATLYGDMAGGFAVLKDVFKNEVYALARYRNTISPVIPDSILTKAPSAELRPNQRDEDSLPPYDRLDPILEAYIEDDASSIEITARGHDKETVDQVITLVDRAEYKRRQAPPGPKVTDKAFGRDRRLPITNRWRERDGVELPDKVTGSGGPT